MRKLLSFHLTLSCIAGEGRVRVLATQVNHK